MVVNDTPPSRAAIQVRGDNMLLEMKAPDPRTILRTGDNLFIYTPGLKRVEEYNLGKNRALVDQFLLLGFGTDSKEMQKSYLVTLMKEDKIDDQKAIELELTPKIDAVRSPDLENSDLARRIDLAACAAGIFRGRFGRLFHRSILENRPESGSARFAVQAALAQGYRENQTAGLSCSRQDCTTHPSSARPLIDAPLYLRFRAARACG